MPHTTKTSNMLFVFNPIMRSCHSNQKTNSEIVTWLMTSSSRCDMGSSLQSRRFLTKTQRYIDRGRHLEKQRKRLRGRGGVLNPSTSPLKTLFDSSQLSGSINVQDGGTTSFLKTIHGSRPKIRLLCRLHGKIFYGKCYLVVVWHYSTYKMVKVIKLFKTCLKGFWDNIYDNYNLLL